MKLISCYVENFGNISNKSFSFERLSALCEKNGFGKTTLASFIKAMFYGLPRPTSKETDRQRYYPFNGGKFGGNIAFEKGGDEYRVERFFGKKSTTEDECRIFKNGKPVDFAESVGKEIFGLDEASFMRTVFVNSQETEVSATSSINAKLNNFVDATDEHNNYDSAMEILKQAKKRYRADRGSGGAISAVRENIAVLKGEIKNGEDIQSSLSTAYAEREGISKKIAELEQADRQARQSNLVLQRWETYSSYLADAEKEKRELSELESKYPAGLPSREEMDGLATAVRAKESASDKLESISFSEQKKARLYELSLKFKDGTPTEAELKSALEKTAEIKTESLSGKFPAGVPTGGEVETYLGKIAELRNLKLAPQAVQKKSKKITFALAPLALALIVSGIALLFVTMTAGIILLACGLLTAGAFVYFRLTGSQSVQSGSQAKIADLESSVASFLVKYGYYSGSGVEVDFNNLLRDMDEYSKTLEKTERSRILRGELENYLLSYGESGADFQQGVLNLKASVSEYSSLKEESNFAEAKENELRGELENSNAVADKILKKYGIPESADLGGLVKILDSDRREYDRLKNSVRVLSEKAEAFKKEYKLDKKPEGEMIDAEELAKNLSALRTRLSDIDRGIDSDEAVVERLQIKRNDLELEEEKLKEYQGKYELISKAMEALERAENNLKDKFVSPVRDKFLHYSKALEEALGESISMDTDFKVSFERSGELRSDLHLSAGQKSLCALCLRLALIDNMYGGEAPFVIMDDPFVHLDAEHMERAKVLLKNLSIDLQIIYFCCHESRLI